MGRQIGCRSGRCGWVDGCQRHLLGGIGKGPVESAEFVVACSFGLHVQMRTPACVRKRLLTELSNASPVMFPYYRSLQSFWPGLLTLWGVNECMCVCVWMWI